MCFFLLKDKGGNLPDPQAGLRPGILLCMLCILLWCLYLCHEFRAIFISLEAAPRASSPIRTRAQWPSLFPIESRRETGGWLKSRRKVMFLSGGREDIEAESLVLRLKETGTLFDGTANCQTWRKKTHATPEHLLWTRSLGLNQQEQQTARVCNIYYSAFSHQSADTWAFSRVLKTKGILLSDPVQTSLAPRLRRVDPFESEGSCG